jgi:hypothetical protein
MRTRHLGQALVGLAATALTVGLLGLPAAAATGAITTGTLSLIGAEGQGIHDFVFPPATPCTSSTASFTMSGTATSGTWVLTIFRNSGENIGGQNFKVTLTMTLTGSYTGEEAPARTLTSGTATMVAIKSTPTDACIPNTGAGNCPIQITDLIVSGTHTVTSPPTVQSGAEVYFNGNNGAEGDLAFEVGVTGTLVNCGSLMGADDGAVVLTDMLFVAD